MKLFSALKYYFSSIPTLINNSNFWSFPIIFFKKPILIKTSKKINLYVNNLMDIWTIKEVIMDECYEKFKTVKKNDLVIDIGASIGDFSILSSKKGAKKIYAIEMNKKLVQIMKKNIKFNNAKNIIIINKKINSLDEIFHKYKIKKCNFLKVDCEGCEYQIFKKINQSNFKKIKYIALEIHLFNEKMKKEFSDLKKLLIRNKFKLKEIDNPVHNYLKFLFAQNEIT